jgi:hypothetical protein
MKVRRASADDGRLKDSIYPMVKALTKPNRKQSPKSTPRLQLPGISAIDASPIGSGWGLNGRSVAPKGRQIGVLPRLPVSPLFRETGLSSLSHEGSKEALHRSLLCRISWSEASLRGKAVGTKL